MKPELIIALDNASPEQARTLVLELSRVGVKWFKVGLELYTQAGPAFVSELKAKGMNVFLDLKLYDIPNTVAKAVRAAVHTGADLLTIHCSGGAEMLSAAQSEAGSHLSLLGVTVLTSFGGTGFDEVCRAWGASEGRVPRTSVVLELARMAAHAGLPGIVCSASDLHGGELRKIDWRIDVPLFVTPGIRNEADSKDDQKSVTTVRQAVRLGSTHLVVGRPITAPPKGVPGLASADFLRQIEEEYGV